MQYLVKLNMKMKGVIDIKKARININEISKAKDFVNIVSKFPYDIDLSTLSDRYIIDAKSIMGVFSLDLSKDLEVVVYDDNCDDFMNAISNYMV